VRAEIKFNPQRIVIKLGSSAVTKKEGGVDPQKIEAIVENLLELKAKGIEIVVVSSGAIHTGRGVLGFTTEDREQEKGNISLLQALSAVGQPYLIKTYGEIFERKCAKCAQVLLTHDDFGDRQRFFNARNTLHELLKRGVIPILNENDSVSFEEISLGDNDQLAAKTASMIHADLVLLLSETDGLYTFPPGDPRAQQVQEIPFAELKDEEHFMRKLKLSSQSSAGRGGMRSKLEAVKKMAQQGIAVIIASHSYPYPIARALQESVGSFFYGKESRKNLLPAQTSREEKKWWAISTVKHNALIKVDKGAFLAISKSASLLPAGIVATQGTFRRGDCVAISYGKKIFAYGLCEYNDSDVRQIMGHKSVEIEKILGLCPSEEVIHRNNLILRDDS